MTADEGAPTLLEIRTYRLVPGRREYFEERSRALTFPLFRKYGFRLERFWTATDDPLKVVYVLAWRSAAEREEKQAAFDSDPDWVAMMTAPDFEPSIADAERVLLEPFVGFEGGGSAAIGSDTRSMGERLFGGYIPKLATIVDEVVMGDVWERDELTPRERSLITIAALVASGAAQQIPGHVRRGLDNGLSPDEVKEALVHLSFYAGFPRTINAANAIREVLQPE